MIVVDRCRLSPRINHDREKSGFGSVRNWAGMGPEHGFGQVRDRLRAALGQVGLVWRGVIA
jgi:hypothetical protein